MAMATCVARAMHMMGMALAIGNAIAMRRSMNIPAAVVSSAATYKPMAMVLALCQTLDALDHDGYDHGYEYGRCDVQEHENS